MVVKSKSSPDLRFISELSNENKLIYGTSLAVTAVLVKFGGEKFIWPTVCALQKLSLHQEKWIDFKRKRPTPRTVEKKSTG